MVACNRLSSIWIRAAAIIAGGKGHGSMGAGGRTTPGAGAEEDVNSKGSLLSLCPSPLFRRALIRRLLTMTRALFTRYSRWQAECAANGRHWPVSPAIMAREPSTPIRVYSTGLPLEADSRPLPWHYRAGKVSVVATRGLRSVSPGWRPVRVISIIIPNAAEIHPWRVLNQPVGTFAYAA